MIHNLNEIPSKEVFPGFVGRFIHSDNMTFAYWEIKKGSSLPEHSHVHEQVVNMLEGEFEITLNGEANPLTAGMVLPIPSHAKHAGRAITDCKILDVFYPVREDYK
jgi:quercetin dioxygenase-like cupin family protein